MKVASPGFLSFSDGTWSGETISNNLRMPRLSTLTLHTISTILCSYMHIIGFGGLGVACWPLVPKFVGSNPAEAVGFLRAKKSSARLPSEGK